MCALQPACCVGNECGLLQRFAARKGHTALVPAQDIRLPVEHSRQCFRRYAAPGDTVFRRSLHGLRLRMQTLGIMAPGAPEGASLQEYRRADSRTIVDREFLNVENDSVLHQSPCM